MSPRRLHTSADVRAVFAARSLAHGSAMVVHARSQRVPGTARVTVVAGRKIGGAVRRNRAKRRLRAALQCALVPDGLDVIVVAKLPALTMDFGSLTGQLDALLAQVGHDRRVA